jgi:hypothetical protein
VQVFVGLSLAGDPFPAVGFVGDLVEHSVGVGDPGEIE